MDCVRCPQLAATRTQIVWGTGPEPADLMLVGDVPSRGDDASGTPFTGAAGALVDELLARIGRSRADVYLTQSLLCRPPDNRDPLPQETANCGHWRDAQLAAVRPVVVCALGNLATRVLRGSGAGVARLHGRAEVRTIGPLAVRLLPLFHPAAALYAAALRETLIADFAQVPELLALGPPDQPAPAPAPAPAPRVVPEPEGQLGLF